MLLWALHPLGLEGTGIPLLMYWLMAVLSESVAIFSIVARFQTIFSRMNTGIQNMVLCGLALKWGSMKSLNLNLLIDKTLLLSANLLKIDGVKVEKRLDPNLPDLVGS